MTGHASLEAMRSESPPEALGDGQASEPTPGDRLLLLGWCAACLVGTLSLFVYLPMSSLPELAALSEHPTPLTILFGLSAASAAVITRKARHMPAFNGAHTPLRAGSVTAILGFLLYVTYVYGMSSNLAVAQAAPQVGDEAPGFRVTDPDGRVFDLQNYRGAPVLLVFYRGQW